MARKILNTHDLKEYCLPAFREAFGENLICAFAHGDCLMEKFSPANDFWQVSFVLKDNAPEAIAALSPYLKNAEKIGVAFGYFFTGQDIRTSEDTFPLEYLHIANRHFILTGNFPLTGFIPHRNALRHQCERELRGLLVRLHREFVYMHQKKTALDFLLLAEREILPVLYGVYFLLHGKYPESKAEVLGAFPKFLIESPSRDAKEMMHRTNNYILAVSEIVQQVDSLEVS